MDRKQKTRKAKAGLLLIASPRFKNLGEGCAHGTYHDRKLKVVDDILAGLDFLDVTFEGIVYEREDVENAIRSFNAAELDFVIAEFLSWSEDFAWIRFLRDMPEIPVIFCNVVKDRMSFENTLEEDDFIEYLCSGTLVGSLEASGSISRIDRKALKTVMGSREEVNARIREFAAAAKTRSLLRHSSVGLLASYNEAMWSTYIHPYDIFTKIGPEIRFLAYSDFGNAIDSIPEEELDAWCKSLTENYTMYPDVKYDKFRASAAASLALAKMAQKSDADLLVYNDIDAAMFRVAGCRAGFYHPWFDENCSMLVPEADTGAGLICYILKLISGKHVNFIEPFHIEREKGTFDGGHAGPNDHNDPEWRDNVVIAKDVRFEKSCWKHAGAPFAWYRISPGLKTLAQLIEDNGRYKIICGLAESLPGKHCLATYSHSTFRPLIDPERFFEQVLKIGSTQHFAVADGDWIGHLRTFAEIMGFDFFEIS